MSGEQNDQPHKNIENPENGQEPPEEGQMDADGQNSPPRSPMEQETSPVKCLSASVNRNFTQRRTPKRCLSMDDIDTPPKSKSSTEDVFMDSPTPVDSPSTFERPRHARARARSTPAFSATSTGGAEGGGSAHGVHGVASTSAASAGEDSNSGDSMSHLEAFMREQSIEVKDTGFKVPHPITGQRKFNTNEEARVTSKSSPFGKLRFRRSLSFVSEDSPVATKRKSTGRCPSEPEIKRMPSPVSSQDSSFNEGLDSFQPEQEGSSPAPKGMSSLMSEPVIGTPSPVGSKISASVKAFMDHDDENTPVRKYRLAKRNMHRSQSEVVTSQAQPLQPSVLPESLSPRTLQRRHSASEAIIKEAVHRMTEEPNLIADSSMHCLLPTVLGKHQELKSISHETLRDLINGKYSEDVEDFHIIDCRYPYEYEGGHIVNAVNICRKNKLLETYLQNPVRKKETSKRFFLIFHCEFSSERGPNLYRQLRESDRMINYERYPHLYYPEIYLLEGGYSTFYAFHKDLCEPQNYVEMLNPAYNSEFVKYQEDKKKSGKKKTKNLSLGAGGSGGGRGRPSGAFRSLHL